MNSIHALPFRVVFLALTAAILAALAGCGPRSHKTYPVEGRVVFKSGMPLSGGLVEFEALGPRAKGLNARGQIQPDGTFRLDTYRSGDGAVEGAHRVIVRPRLPHDTTWNEGRAPRPVLQPRYQSYEKSGLRFTVAPEQNRFTILVE